ncbi:MAG: hypothetical protein ABIT83_12305 [Massilia sp.]
MGFFKWGARAAALDTSTLGTATLALSMPSGCVVPEGCVGLVVDAGGRTRRVAEGAKLSSCGAAAGWCFHPGPYQWELRPFAQVPEIGLRLNFSVDSLDPRVSQQRFDLYLASEAQDQLALDAFCGAIEAALQRELAQGGLDLPPCTTLDEWNAFRAGFNQLLYTRFGVTVDDCVPVDLAAQVDYAQILLARIEANPVAASENVIAPAPTPAPIPNAATDRHALRRLFLELPYVMCGLRQAVLPSGQALFRQHQALLERLDLASLAASTMPALELASPCERLADAEQVRRIAHSRAALMALDEAWSLLARLRHAADTQLEALFDDADRIVANLETALAGRRAISESEQL